LPGLAFLLRPTFRQPELGPLVAAIVDESAVFAVGNGPRRDAEGMEQRAMARAFIVEGEALTVMADIGEPAFVFDPVKRRRRIHGLRRAGAISGHQRIAEEGVLDVG